MKKRHLLLSVFFISIFGHSLLAKEVTNAHKEQVTADLIKRKTELENELNNIKEALKRIKSGEITIKTAASPEELVDIDIERWKQRKEVYERRKKEGKGIPKLNIDNVIKGLNLKKQIIKLFHEQNKMLDNIHQKRDTMKPGERAKMLKETRQKELEVKNLKKEIEKLGVKQHVWAIGEDWQYK